MPRIIRTPRSGSDLQRIFNYIAQNNLTAAQDLMDKIDQNLRALAQFPHLGPSQRSLPRNVRSFSTGMYSLYYRPMPDGIVLLRVLHAAQDVRRASITN